MATGLAREAAQSRRLTTPRGLMERIFANTFDGLVYPQIWEDPIVDLEALELDETKSVVAISSGGCNVMSYLVAGPARILTVDLSPAHIALLKLKIAAALHLDYPAFWRLFGDAADKRNLQSYMLLRPHIDRVTRAYWEGRMRNGRRRISRFTTGFYRAGMLGRCIGFGHLLARMHGAKIDRLLAANDLDEQRQVFENELAPLFNKPLPRLLARFPAAFFGLGIPPAQFDAMAEEAGEGMPELVRQRLARLACNFPIHDNYYAWQAFGRRYDPQRRSLPPYLAPESFEWIKSGAGRIEPNLMCLTARLADEPRQSLDAFVLLDAQDWMTRDQLTGLWREIDRTAATDARVIFRTAGTTSMLEAQLPPSILANWTYDASQSAALHEKDRSAIYGGFHLYRRSAA
jgi:S-adenosylmethionine-diacylglycerol 3-amino-3-carboxypropyl transferase